MRSSIVLVFVFLAAGFVFAEATAGSCADYFAQAALNAGSAAGDNHPHAVDLGLMNYEAICGAAPTAAPTPAPIAAVTPTLLPTIIKCTYKCSSDMLQRDYPNCGCYVQETCNACPTSDYTQDAWPSCACTLNVAVAPRVCDSTCLVGFTQTAYPACDCLKQAYAAHCDNACAAGQMQMPFPDCRCSGTTTVPSEESGRPGDNHPHPT